jgi:hypothetical protein
VGKADGQFERFRITPLNKIKFLKFIESFKFKIVKLNN